MLGLKVKSKAISTSFPASLNSSPWTRFVGTSDEFFDFKTMSASQAQHKLDTVGEINSINSFWSSRTVRHVYEKEEKVSVPWLNVMARFCEVWDGACDLTH